MNDLVQPGNVHLKGPLCGSGACELAVCGCVDEDVDGVWDEEAFAVEMAAARCFLEMWPVRAASELNVDVHPPQAQVKIPLVQCAALRCFLRSVIEAKEAEHVLPQGISHWQTRSVVWVDGVDTGVGTAIWGCSVSVATADVRGLTGICGFWKCRAAG
jgi:hypothetical protein